MKVRQQIVTALTLSTATAAPGAAQNLDGRWRGAMSIPAAGVELGFSVHFTTVGDSLTATIDIPRQGAQGLPLERVTHDPPNVRFELPTGAATAVWEGAREGDVITGQFTQGPAAGTFTVTREGAADTAATADEALPYDAHEVQVRHGDITLAGTLTMPRGEGPFPAAILLTGSGPQNRDEEMFGFKPFRLIADHLTRRGIAVLRYDDRGVGGSTGSLPDATVEDFAGDALAAVAFLQARADIAGGDIGLVGHSEGGIVAPLAATRSDDVSFVVLLAGPAVSGEEILYAQGELIVRAGGGGDEAAAAQRALQGRIFRALRTDSGWAEVEADVARELRAAVDAMPEQQRGGIPDVDAYVDAQVRAQLTSVRSPWFRHFIDYDPAPTLRALRTPVLALFGELDLQVPPDLNLGAMRTALTAGGNPDVSLEILPRANHLFLTAETGSPAEYASLPQEVVPGLLDRLADWIGERTGR